MNTQRLSALEVEALTYIYTPDESSFASERLRRWRESLRAHAVVAGVQVIVALGSALTWAVLPLSH